MFTSSADFISEILLEFHLSSLQILLGEEMIKPNGHQRSDTVTVLRFSYPTDLVLDLADDVVIMIVNSREVFDDQPLLRDMEIHFPCGEKFQKTLPPTVDSLLVNRNFQIAWTVAPIEIIVAPIEIIDAKLHAVALSFNRDIISY